MLPGPTNVPERVMNAMINPVMGHRTPDFSALMKSVVGKAKKIFQTSGDIIVLTASGTGGVEAAITNIIRRNDKAIVSVYGEFGERAALIVEGAGGVPIKAEAPYGDVPRIDQLEEAFEKNKEVKALIIVTNETSTGTSFKWLKEAGELASKYGSFLILDAVSNLVGDDIPVDKIGADVVATGSQKCLAAPPGLALLSLSERAKKLIVDNPPPGLYFNLARQLKYSEIGQTPFTPALPIYHAIDEAMTLVLEEGLEHTIKRHKVCAEAFYSSFESMGLDLFCKKEVRSNTVVSVNYPSGVDDKQFRGTLDQLYRVVIAGGFGAYKGKLFRIGSMGEVNKYHVITTISAINNTLMNLLGKSNEKDPVEVAKDILREL
jgi:aspartate aminotransferase-like enzyme